MPLQQHDFTITQEEDVFVLGTVKLIVVSGRVVVLGKIVTPESGALRICADNDWGGALKICCSNTCAKAQISIIELPGQECQVSTEAGELQYIVIPSVWYRAKIQICVALIQQPLMPTSILICGSRGSGKSTFGRYLVNCMLNLYSYVMYLDADCGQSEFGVPGLLGLVKVDKPLFDPPVQHHKQKIQGIEIFQQSRQQRA
eukprot:TRINITY_DN28385_c1_g1_i2.p2 TRINITY_DN28385_c1_g1~~TRINITY_DN28385_c1_g1_i2.p2  ORF type:complete len:218 (-),score=16.93 TRINITY_DN28385_c1_g1_i2:50-652(-)